MIDIRICVLMIVSDVHGRTVAWSTKQVGYGGLELGLSLHSACRSLDFYAPKDRELTDSSKNGSSAPALWSIRDRC